MVDRPLQCRLRDLRSRQGLSQVQLARKVGVSRQALVAIEAGRQTPSTRLALELSAALGCRVEELFQLPEALLEARPCRGYAPKAGERVVLGRVGESWVAQPFVADASRAADALVLAAAPESLSLRPLTEPRRLADSVLVAGCAPLIGALASRTRDRYRDVRVTWLSVGSRRSLELLDDEAVHVAGVHRLGGADEDNVAALRRLYPHRSLVVVNLTRWRQGLVLPEGNPLELRGVEDLLRPGLRVALREAGAGASRLVEDALAELGCPTSTGLQGPAAQGHADLARLVSAGAADVGVGIESEALAAGLDFLALDDEHFDLVMTPQTAALPSVERMLNELVDGSFRCEVASIDGYDLSRSGQRTRLDRD